MIKKAGRPKKRPDKNTFETMYSAMTAPELAKHYGVTSSTIYQWANQFRKEENKGGGKIKKCLQAV